MLSKIFVYGSLNTPSNKFSKTLAKNAQQLGGGKISGILYNLGNYPGAVESDSSHKIRGYIYRMNDPEMLTALDVYEEYNKSQPEKSLFIRKAVYLIDERGKRHRAWVYFYNRPVKMKNRIKTGDYQQFRKTKGKRKIQ